MEGGDSGWRRNDRAGAGVFGTSNFLIGDGGGWGGGSVQVRGLGREFAVPATAGVYNKCGDSGWLRSICVGSQAVFGQRGPRPIPRVCHGQRWRSVVLSAFASLLPAPVCPACCAPASPGKASVTPRDAAPPALRHPCCRLPAISAAARCLATGAPVLSVLPPSCRQFALARGVVNLHGFTQ